MTISEKIFRYMDAAEMLQIDFARKTGISQSTISDWKRKKTNPAADKISVICNTLGITPNDLLCDNENKTQDNERDYIIIKEGSEKYRLLTEFECLDLRKKERLMGYLEALKK
ncbi:MAG: helix-turn-helix transcriptional regulator [Eubacterium sp.]|nr:helix-turn-helix transcriptional regulator [Eubacterium sp.]